MSRQKEGELDLSFIMRVAKSTGFESCVGNPLIRCVTLDKVQRQSCSTFLSPSVLSMNRKWGGVLRQVKMVHGQGV